MKSLLRFTTAGSVDDGKSTLIGRLLYDAKSVMMDQWEAVERSSQRKGLSHVDLSLLTDGLKDEREQGITIDVAYRYFSTPHRTFIIADTPGHVQYTRNMVTGASTAEVALVLVDARQGVVEQTRRHLFIAGLLGLPMAIVCVNKMDLVQWSEEAYAAIVQSIGPLAKEAGISNVIYLPMSALLGDNVVDPSQNMPWYSGSPLLQTLEEIDLAPETEMAPFRFAVQTVLRPHTVAHHDFRGYAGRVASGAIHLQDSIVVYPGGHTTTVTGLWIGEQSLSSANCGQSITLELAGDTDVSRGSLIARSSQPQPRTTQEVVATLCWLDAAGQRMGSKYIVRCATAESRCLITETEGILALHSLQFEASADLLQANDIAKVHLRFAKPLTVDPYTQNRTTGAFILIDEASGTTVAAGMIS